jgi:DNA-binding transcriptional ArsR family regulator
VSADIFAAVASPIRRELLRLLRDEGPMPVQQLADHFEMRRPSVSEHLKVLRDAGLVGERRSGRRRYYELEGEALQEIFDWLVPYERYWRNRRAARRQVIEERD